MQSEKIFKLFKIEEQEAKKITFALSYRSFASLNNTEIFIAALSGNLLEIDLQTAEFGGKLEKLNIVFNLSKNGVVLQEGEPVVNETFPFLSFNPQNIENSLTFLSEIVYNILIPKYELSSNISYYGDTRT